MNKEVKIFDSYLRDGAQARNVSFSIEDKIKILLALDNLGVAYVEAGNPGSNSKDKEFFERVKGLKLRHTKLAAFGSTRRKDALVEEDDNIQQLLSADTGTIVIFGKSWDFHVTDVIQTTLDENIAMIQDTVKFFKDQGKEVIYDAEHFFDGYKSNERYALRTLQAAKDGGADCLVLCDTNGGSFPDDIYDVTKLVFDKFKMEIGIHCHNDTGMAEANSIMAVKAGAIHVQGTFIGIGERCGNANLATIIANLQLKKKYHCIPKEKMALLTETARYVAEITNMRLNPGSPYVGTNAFAHKGGMHIDGVAKASNSFEHISPELVGNHRTFLMSEVAGKNAILKTLKKIDPSITKTSREAKELIGILKEMEHDGYQFEAAETSFEMLVRKHLGKYKPFFKVQYYRIIEEDAESSKELSASAMIKIVVDGQEEMTASEGNGPVNALDKALRKAIEVFYPNLKEMKLIDYKVRVIDSGASASKVRVLIESTDTRTNWTTVGVSTNIIEASMQALMDSIEYKLLKDEEEEIIKTGGNI
jgi:2-isopropylmalate synthase